MSPTPPIDLVGFEIVEDGQPLRIVRSPRWPHWYRVVWLSRDPYLTDMYRPAFTLRGARRIRDRLRQRYGVGVSRG